MPSIADYKKEIILKKKLKENSLFTLQELFKTQSKEEISAIVEEIITSKEFISLVLSKIIVNDGLPGKDGKDGIDGKNGIDGKDGEQGPRGEKGEDGLPGTNGIDGQNGKDGSSDTGEQIVGKINNLELTPDKQIDAKHIKGLPKEKEMRESVALFRGGLKLVWNIQLDGTVDGVNDTFTIPGNYPEPKEGKIIVSARGVLKDETSGDFTISGRTIVFAGIPPLGSAQPRVVLYHGK